MGIPDRFHLGTGGPMVIAELMSHIKHEQEDTAWYNPLNKPTIMGYVIPDFQRPLVWSDAQQIKFIESIWVGMPLGSYSYTYLDDGDEFPEQHNILVDGQQRLHAIERYIGDEITVFGLKWSEVDIVKQRRFKQTTFSRYEINNSDDAYIREYYNRMNFGGVAHKEEERA